MRVLDLAAVDHFRLQIVGADLRDAAVVEIALVEAGIAEGAAEEQLGVPRIVGLQEQREPREPDPLYRELLELRKSLPRELETHADEAAQVLRLRRGEVELVADFRAKKVDIRR